MKKWDKIIIVMLLILSFLPYVLLKKLTMINDYEATYARITIGGEIYEDIPLHSQQKRQERKLQTVDGYNIICIENGSVMMIETDCPDKVCMEPGAIYEPGKTLICLPHKLLIEIKGQKVDDTLDAVPY
jgi:hypothetical protein